MTSLPAPLRASVKSLRNDRDNSFDRRRLQLLALQKESRRNAIDEARALAMQATRRDDSFHWDGGEDDGDVDTNYDEAEG